LNFDGSISKHKAKLVSRGFLQKQGIGYNDVFAHVANRKNWPIYPSDMKSNFLNGPLEKTIYVTQPPRIEITGKGDLVYKLNKALSDLKQALRAWNKRIYQFLIQLGFKKCIVEYGVHVMDLKGPGSIIVCLYVDDLLITGSNLREVENFKLTMNIEFEMTNLGVLTYFLAMDL
jgi:hypothetical protein